MSDYGDEYDDEAGGDLFTEADMEQALAEVRDAAYKKGLEAGRVRERGEVARLLRFASTLNGSTHAVLKAIEEGDNGIAGGDGRRAEVDTRRGHSHASSGVGGVRDGAEVEALTDPDPFAKGFDPDEKRDAHGRWAKTAADDAADAEIEQLEGKLRDHHAKRASEMEHKAAEARAAVEEELRAGTPESDGLIQMTRSLIATLEKFARERRELAAKTKAMPADPPDDDDPDDTPLHVPADDPVCKSLLASRYAELATRYGERGALSVFAAAAQMAAGSDAAILKAFDPNEKRDEAGKWTAGAGGGGRRGEPAEADTEEGAAELAPDKPEATPDNLLNIADALRSAMEAAAGDPKDQCIACAYALKKYYPEAKVSAGEVNHGEYGAPHTLAFLAGHFIDVTADQFGAKDTVRVLTPEEMKRSRFYRFYDAFDDAYPEQPQWETQRAIEAELAGRLKAEARNVARWEWREARGLND